MESNLPQLTGARNMGFAERLLTFKRIQTDSISNTYDKLNRLVASAYLNSGNQQTQRYDYAGRRVFRQENTSAPDLYFSRHAEFDASAVLTQYYYAGSRLVAARWNYDPDFGAAVPPAAPLRIPPELPVAVGTAAILLLLGFGRRERRMLVVIGPSRALGASLLLFAAAPPIGLFTPAPAQAECDPEIYTVHYHLDHLGSTQVITNSVGSLHQQIRYTAYGQVRGRWDASGTPVGPDPTGLTREFTGYESDNLTGFQYAGARFYDPELGQFLSHDPAGQFASPYAYGPGDPMNGTDPNGELFGWDDVLAVLVIGAILGSMAHSGLQAGKSGASFAEVAAVVASEVGSSIVSAGILGPLSNPDIDPPVALGARLAAIGFGTYSSVQSARGGDAFGAAIAGLNSVLAAYAIADGDTTSGKIGQSQKGDGHTRYLRETGRINRFIKENPGESIPISEEGIHAIVDWEAQLLGDLSSMGELEYIDAVWHADGPFMINWSTETFTVSGPPGLKGTYRGSTINYYAQGLVTASAGRSSNRMHAQIVAWNAGKFARGEFGRFFQTWPAMRWAQYGYNRYKQTIGNP